MRHDISKKRKRSLSGDPGDPSEYHPMRVPRSIHRRMHAAGNRVVVQVLDENLPETPACSE